MRRALGSSGPEAARPCPACSSASSSASTGRTDWVRYAVAAREAADDGARAAYVVVVERVGEPHGVAGGERMRSSRPMPGTQTSE